MNPIQSYKSPHFQKTPIKVEFVVLHYTAQNLSASLNIFLNPKSKVSCHLLIDEEGLLYEMISCWNGTCYKAFHAGKSFWIDSSDQKWDDFNDFSIGIEMVNFNGNVFSYTKKQYETLFQTLHHLKTTYPALQNPERILGHENIAGFRNKSDPGYLFDWKSVFKEVYQTEKPTNIIPLLTQKQHQSLSFLSKSLTNSLAKKISLLLEINMPFYFKILLIKILWMGNQKKNAVKNQKGQIIVEYILLLIISVLLALTLIKITDLSTGSVFLNYWSKMLNIIATDIST